MNLRTQQPTANTALIYVRKSMVRNRRDEISPERQLSNCRAAVDNHGWRTTEHDVYQDAEGHRSGRTEEHRPAWQALKDRITSDPSVTAVVVNSLDRGSRSPKDFFNFLDAIQQHGVELVSCTEQFDTTTAIGRAFLAILMVIASLESDLASERTTSTIEFLKSKGLHWGFTPYGYTRDEESGILQPNANADAVLEALAYFVEGGHSYDDVASHMNAHPDCYRWRDRDGEPRPFHRYAIRSIISNVAIYAGWLPNCRCKDIPLGEIETLADMISLTDAIAGAHPPLIDDDMADRILAARANRRQMALAVRRPARTYILTPILYCAHCGQQLRGKRDKLRGTACYCHRDGAADCIKAAGLSETVGDGSHDAECLECIALRLLNIALPPAVITDLRAAATHRRSITSTGINS